LIGRETHPGELALVSFDLFEQHAMIFFFESWLHLVEGSLVYALLKVLISLKWRDEYQILGLIEYGINTALDDVKAHLPVAVSELHAVL